MRRSKLIGRWFFGSMLGLPLLLLLLLGSNLWTFSRLSHEQVVADIRFRQLGPARFLAVLLTPDGQERRLVLEGDQWQLDARVIKWQSWANLLGLDAMYRLERLSGRYSRVDQARLRAPSVYALAPEVSIDLWALTEPSLHWLPLFDAVYGSAVYLPMRDALAYHVFMSQTGLLARPAAPSKGGEQY